MTTLAYIRALARSGASDRAWAAFVAAGWDRSEADVDALCVKGRLLKDRARRADAAERARLYRAAGEAYAAAAALAPATYPLINAATLALLGGSPAVATNLARRTMDLLDRGAHAPETPYWLAATRAEALLLLDRPAEAQAALSIAVARAPAAWEDHAATLRQFALVLAAGAGDAGWLDRFRPPVSLHFQGIMGLSPDDATAAARIDAAVAEERPGFAFGALAAGTDILVAEAVMRRAGELHVLLPCPLATFRTRSVTAVDPRWGPRFDALIDAATSVETVEDSPIPGPAAVAIGDAMAMGLAIARARQLQTKAVALLVTDEGKTVRADPDWTAAGGCLRAIAIERSAAVLDERDEDPREAVAVIALSARIDPPEIPLPGLCWQERADDMLLLALASPAAALEAAGTIAARTGPATAIALDYGLASEHRIAPALAARVATIAGAADDGNWLASRPMALALERVSPSPRIEIAGEVRGPSGHHAIFTVGTD